jgi:hypothetical protein
MTIVGYEDWRIVFHFSAGCLFVGHKSRLCFGNSSGSETLRIGYETIMSCFDYSLFSSWVQITRTRYRRR